MISISRELVCAENKFDEVQNFLQRIGNFLVYYSPDYLKFLTLILPDSEIGYFVARKNSEIVGVMPFALASNDANGGVMNSLPFFGGHGGPLIDSSIDLIDVLVNLVEAYDNTVQQQDVKAVTIVENPFQTLDQDFLKRYHLSVIDKRISQITELPPKNSEIEVELFNKFHVKTRNAIRKGQKSGVVITEETSGKMLQWLQHVHEKSISAMGGVVKPLTVFEKLTSVYKLGENSKLYIGRIDGLEVCGLLVLLYEGTVEYFTPVILDEYKNSQAFSFLIYEVMKKSSFQGFQRWNWGGTWQSQEGVFRFKSRFGSTDREYRYFNSVNPEILAVDPQELKATYPYFYVYKY